MQQRLCRVVDGERTRSLSQDGEEEDLSLHVRAKLFSLPSVYPHLWGAKGDPFPVPHSLLSLTTIVDAGTARLAGRLLALTERRPEERETRDEDRDRGFDRESKDETGIRSVTVCGCRMFCPSFLVPRHCRRPLLSSLVVSTPLSFPRSLCL